jgi:hypothetical protein
MNNNSQELVREAARRACTQQLQDVLVPVVYEGIYLLWMKAKEQEEAKQIGSSYVAFQNNLSMIPKWNNLIVKKRHELCVEKCPWIDRLLEKVFLLNAQLLASVGGNRQNRLAVRVPESTLILHTCFINASKRFWYLPRLFEDRIGKHVTIQEQQQNMQRVFDIIKETIETTVLELLPMQAILDDGSVINPQNPMDWNQLPLLNMSDQINKLEEKPMEYPPLMQKINPIQPMQQSNPIPQITPMQQINPMQQTNPMQQGNPMQQDNPMQQGNPMQQINPFPVNEQSPPNSPVKEPSRLPVFFNKEPTMESFRDVPRASPAGMSPAVEDILKNGRVLKNQEMEVIDGSSIPFTKPLI